MRLCPSVEGSAPPLITHRIGVEVCMARQRTFFHKCHRCIYRGQAANWAPEESALVMMNMHTAEEPVKADVKTVDLSKSRAPAAKKPGRGKGAAAAGKAAEAAS